MVEGSPFSQTGVNAMSSQDLEAAVEGLPTERIRRLLDGLERDPEVKLCVGAWWPQCPMVLAAFDPRTAAADPPEARFAAAWDRLATPGSRWQAWISPVGLCAGRVACRADVELLIRVGNQTLARRAQLPRPRRELDARGSLAAGSTPRRAGCPAGSAADPELRPDATLSAGPLSGAPVCPGRSRASSPPRRARVPHPARVRLGRRPPSVGPRAPRRRA